MAANILTLLCVISGELASNAFKVKLDINSDVSELKELIKTKKTPEFDDIAANTLTLWHVTISVDDDVGDEIITATSITTKRLLKGTGKISKAFGIEVPGDSSSERLFKEKGTSSRTFEDGIPEDTIHIIVERPLAGADPKVDVLRKQLSDMRRISISIVDKRDRENEIICQYVADTKTATLEKLQQLLRPHFEQFDGDDYVQIHLYLPGSAMPVWLANDNVLRSCLQIAKDKGYKSFTISLDTPAKDFSSYTWEDVQRQYGVREPELIPGFDIQPRLLLDNEKTVLKHIVQDCIFKNKAYLLGPGASEAAKSSVVDSFMVGAIQSYVSDMFLAQQRQMSGMRGRGAVDFAVIDRIHLSQVLGVTKVKKEKFAQGLAQNMVELDVAVQQKKRKRMDEVDEDSGERPPVRFKSYGIVTDSFKWIFVECALDEEDVLTYRTKDIPGMLDLKQGEEDVKKDCEKVFSYVLALYELMKDT